jgi:hypothetical protein
MKTLPVPRVHFYEGGKRCPEDICLPSCLRAVAEFLGDTDFGCKHCLAANLNCKIFCSYAFLTGVSGAAAFLSWQEGWSGDNPGLVFMARDPYAAERRAFAALGYELEILEKVTGRDNESLFRQAVVDSLAAGLPVLAYGVIGPPEPCIITGYDPQADALVGWNFFQSDPMFAAGLTFEPGGEFRKPNWFADTLHLDLIRARRPHPPLKETYRAALDWLLEVGRTPVVWPGADAPQAFRGRRHGLAAYTAWAEQLLRGEEITGGDEQQLRRCFSVHDVQVGTLAEARWYGAQFLIEAANPDYHPPLSLAEDLYHAAAAYAAQHDLMWNLWGLAGGNGNPEGYRLFADPAVRRKMYAVIVAAREKEFEALAWLEKAVQKRR